MTSGADADAVDDRGQTVVPNDAAIGMIGVTGAGKTVFLYAADPGSDEGWKSTLEEVSQKLDRFFEAFIARTGAVIESTPCPCAICRNSNQLGLKIIVHVGEAVFHEIAGRSQVSGPDVILAHRLLKNSIEGNEYLLLSDAAFEQMGEHLAGPFDSHEESYEGFGRVPVRVRSLEEAFLAARDALYQLEEPQLREAADVYLDWVGRSLRPATLQQMRAPIRAFGWRDRLAMLLEALAFPLFRRRLRDGIPAGQLARGKRRTEWAAPPPGAPPSS